jgi:hypothetical protein
MTETLRNEEGSVQNDESAPVTSAFFLPDSAFLSGT